MIIEKLKYKVFYKSLLKSIVLNSEITVFLFAFVIFTNIRFIRWLLLKRQFVKDNT